MDDDPRAVAVRICERLSAAGYRALLAGGCVRDELLGRTPNDYDVATSARPGDVHALYPGAKAVGAAFGVMLIREGNTAVEVATFRSDGPYLDGRHPAHVTFSGEQEDAQRRDFTVNALFLDPADGAVLDYVQARNDLSHRTIRAVGDPARRFQEDHLRLIRAVRFAAMLEFEIEKDTLSAIRECASSIRTTSPERIRDELIHILTGPAPRRAVELLDETGLLDYVLPEVSRMKGVEQPPRFHPEGDVYTHTLLLLENLDSPAPALALAALLHDVGKPLTQTFEDRIRFNQHEKVGAHVARDICRRLHMSNDTIERVEWLVGQHMRVAAAPEMREAKLKRFVRTDGFGELLELFRIDCIASHGRLDTYTWLKEYAENLAPDEARPKPLLTGHDLIRMGHQPGPAFSEILTEVEDAQLEGRIRTKSEAESFVRESWPTPDPTA